MSNQIFGTYIELTEKCNLRCIHCYNNSGNSNKEIDFNKLKEMIIFLKNNNINSITFSGGEPFLYSHILELLEFCGANNIHVNIITNLNYYNEKLIDIVKKYNVSLQISVDGIYKTYNDIRINGNFDILRKNIDNIYSKKIELSFHFVINRLNFNELDQFVEFVNNNYPNTNIAFSFLNYSGRAIDNIDNLNISNIEKENCINRINKIHEKHSFVKKMEITTGCPYMNLEDTELNVRIDANGNVYPCQICSDEKYIIGNIYLDNLINIINSKSFYNLRKKMIENSKCKKCIWNKNCGHCCPIEVNDYNQSYGCYLIKSTNNKIIQRMNDELKNGIKLNFFEKYDFIIRINDKNIRKYKRIKKFFDTFVVNNVDNPIVINIEKDKIFYKCEDILYDESDLCINLLKIIEKNIIEHESNGVFIHGGLISTNNDKHILILGKSNSGKSTNIYKTLLDNSKFKYGGDDIVYLNFDNNSIYPFPKPIFLRNVKTSLESNYDIEYINGEKRYIYYPETINKKCVRVDNIVILNRNKKHKKVFYEELKGGYKTIELLSNLKENINIEKISYINNFVSSVKVKKINYFNADKLFEDIYEKR